MIDTLRILVDWKCNLSCSYCCNEQERFRKDIHDTSLDEIDWNAYQFFCVSGGEPTLFMDKIHSVLERIPQTGFVILYTNGTRMTPAMLQELVGIGVNAINVGLHFPVSFDGLIRKVEDSRRSLNNTNSVSIRYHARDIYQNDLVKKYPELSFRFWKMDDCDRENEHRVVWTKQ